MAGSIYEINKGVNRSIELKGLRAQYIWYLGAGLVVLLVLFAVLYLCGAGVLVSAVVIGLLGVAMFFVVYRMNKVYGEHGVMKKAARRAVPKVVKIDSLLFMQL